MAYGLGIDAGGTYTDTVIIEMESGQVVCGSKALTTHENLVLGIRDSLAGLDRGILSEVSLASLSSTLATNSVVENKGCRVGLVCIGIDYAGLPRPEQYALIRGRFTMSGKEETPLDAGNARAALNSMKGKVDAVAVSGYVSVRNPSHEKRVETLAKSILGVPVVCAHTLTSKLGFEQRTTTAVMNARLIPVMGELLESVRTVMKEFGIDSGLMVVKGDGGLMKDTVALKKPVETILSGPASSLMGAKALTGLDDAMVIDIGGTTSDIGILKKGFPRIEPEGANIGGKRTRVMAADISTYGIGGDSRIVVNGSGLLLTPVRAIPLCIAADRWPSVRKTVAELADITDDRPAEDCAVGDIVQDTEFFLFINDAVRDDMPTADIGFLDAIRDGPMRIKDVSESLGLPVHAFSVSELEREGHVMRIGMTPTDILHAEGSYARYGGGSSKTAAEYLARKCGKGFDRFVTDTKRAVVAKIARCVAEKVILDGSGRDALSAAEEYMVTRALDCTDSDYSVMFRLNTPIIGIGAPVGAWLPAVSDLLHTRLVLPENSHIGNAVGAITGSVCETASVTVRAAGPDNIEEPECDVFTTERIVTFQRPAEALAFAEREGIRMASEAALAAGAGNPVVEISVEKNEITVSENKRYFRSATVTVKATGKPDLN